jgi:hypothetical protein
MSSITSCGEWKSGSAPIAVIMISLNEGHNLEDACRNLLGWAQEVHLVDSYSRDQTIDIALRYGVRVVQRRFRGFGDQWNFALRELPVNAPWTMKLDPDERVTDALKKSLERTVRTTEAQGVSVSRRLWFMGRPLPVTHPLVRVWRTGACRFTDVSVNEHPLVDGDIVRLAEELEHHDSPDLEHWLHKQNRYTTDEALIRFHNLALAAKPRLLGNTLERRMWLKKHFFRLPFRYQILFCYLCAFEGAWRGGSTGLIWAHLRTEVMRFVEYKEREMRIKGNAPKPLMHSVGGPDPRVPQF